MKASVIFSVLLLLAGMVLPPGSEASNHKHVLVLHSYHKGLVWTDDIMKGILSVFGSDPSIELYVDYMDSKRHFDGLQGRYFSALLDLYRIKFASTKFDAIISSDDNALRFLLLHRGELFPGVPIIFCGVNDYDGQLLSSQENVTGVIEFLDPEETINIALKLHSAAKRIYVITDTSETGNANREIIKDLAQKYSGKAEMVFLDKDNSGLTRQELLDSLSRLPAGEIVYYSDFLRGKEGYIYQETFVPMASEASKSPVYTHYDEILGLGVVGGMLVSGYSHGMKAAQIAARVLNGTPASEIPVYTGSINRYMFDYAQMKRFLISEEDLPQDSIVINKPVSFYETYRTLVWTTAAVVGTLSVLVVLLVLNVARRRAVERSLRRANEETEQRVQERTRELSNSIKEKEVLLKEIHHRVKNNMSIITALLNLQARHSKDENITRAFMDSCNRIKSMALVHEKLYQTYNFVSISLKEYLEELMHHVIDAQQEGEMAITLNSDIDDIALGIDFMIPCGLIVNELVTNSMKHAFKGVEKPQINISFKVADSRAVMTYSDNGRGLPGDIAYPSTGTLGLQIIDILTKQLKGTIEMEGKERNKIVLRFDLMKSAIAQ